jgi:pilus assembly protein Flp/PilA
LHPTTDNVLGCFQPASSGHLCVSCFSARNLVRGEEGATLVEYGLLVGLIAVVAIAGITLMGTSVQTLFNYLAGEIPTGS